MTDNRTTETKILKSCPVCGGKLEYQALYQRSYCYEINKKTGKISDKKRIKGDYSMDCGFISCANCGFSTDTDLKPYKDKAPNFKSEIFFGDGYFYFK